MTPEMMTGDFNTPHICTPLCQSRKTDCRNKDKIIMSQIGDAIQAKCLAFGDRIIKLNDYLLEQAASSMSDGRSQKSDVSKGKSAFIHHTSDISQPSDIIHQPSDIIHHRTSHIPSSRAPQIGGYASQPVTEVRNEYRCQ